MARTTLTRAAGAAALCFMGACAGLDVENPNNPDVQRALASGEDVKNIAISTVNSWYLTSTYLEPYFMLEVTSDTRTANFGNFGMRFNNLEPRLPYENNSAGGDRFVAEEPWNQNYGTLGAANDVIRAIDAGVQIANGVENDKWRAVAAFTQAASLSNLALIFDSAFVVDETFDATAGAPSLVDYNAASTAAMAKWDALIAALAGQSENYTSPQVLPVTTFNLSSATLLEMSNTLAGLTLRLTPRSKTELDARPASFWTQILAYAQGGLSEDLTVQGNFNNWWSYIAAYGAEHSWTRVDYRLLNRMDAKGSGGTPLPIRYSSVADIRVPGNPGNNDQRLGDGTSGDYIFMNGVIGDPGRGIFMQSAYAHLRYDHHAAEEPTAFATPVPYILKAENDLLLAEALIMTGGSKVTAAGLINNTRVGRGALPPLTGAETNAVMLEEIDYERDVELLTTNGFVYFYARSAPNASPLGAPTAGGGRLQPGTVRHLPIPAKELETLALPVYTYGGASNPDMIVIGSEGQVLPLRRPTRTVSPAEKFFLRRQ